MTDTTADSVRIEVSPTEHVSGLWDAPASAFACLVLAHGAGADMNHAFMAEMAAEFRACGIATLRFQFPFAERGSRRPDPAPLSQAAVRAAVLKAAEIAPHLPRFAGGKSFGGRMTSQAQAAAPLSGVRGLVFLGFPLHAAAKPSDTRARHLFEVHIPLLFLQGTRDELADLSLLEPVIEQLGPRARLQLLADADHSFHVRVSSGSTDAAVRAHITSAVAEWMRQVQ